MLAFSFPQVIRPFSSRRHSVFLYPRQAVSTSTFRLPVQQSSPKPPVTPTRANLQNDSNDNIPSDFSIEKYPWSQEGYKGAPISVLPINQQRLFALGVLAVVAAATIIASPYFATQIKPDVALTLGPIFFFAGIGHFADEQGFKNMYPHRGAWGLWYLPGSYRFHILWTGVAEILGGLGMLTNYLCTAATTDSSLHVPFWLSWAQPLLPTMVTQNAGSLGQLIGALAGLGLFLLVAAVTPTHIYMYTHNAPGPVPKAVIDKANGMLPWWGHLTRIILQPVLLAVLLNYTLVCFSAWTG